MSMSSISFGWHGNECRSRYSVPFPSVLVIKPALCLQCLETMRMMMRKTKKMMANIMSEDVPPMMPDCNCRKLADASVGDSTIFVINGLPCM